MISKGIPTELAGPQNPPETDEFEGHSDLASWAPKPPETDDLEENSDQASWAPKRSETDDFEGDSDPASWAPIPALVPSGRLARILPARVGKQNGWTTLLKGKDLSESLALRG
jgi:hypothetical protein